MCAEKKKNMRGRGGADIQTDRQTDRHEALE